MSYISNTGLGVRSHKGPRTAKEGVEGSYKTEGNKYQLALYITAESINDDNFQYNIAQLPAGALVTGVYASVTEAFVIGGTTPVIAIGTDGSEATNGADISEAQGEAIGTYDITGTLAGTWTSSLAAATEVSVALGGTSPTITDVGKVTVTIEYTK